MEKSCDSISQNPSEQNRRTKSRNYFYFSSSEFFRCSAQNYYSAQGLLRIFITIVQKIVWCRSAFSKREIFPCWSLGERKQNNYNLIKCVRKSYLCLYRGSQFLCKSEAVLVSVLRRAIELGHFNLNQRVDLDAKESHKRQEETTIKT